MSNDPDSKSLAIIPRTFDDVCAMAKSLAASALLPEAFRNKEHDVRVQIIAGLELGLPPMVALRSVHIIKGKPTLSADAMVALVLGSGKAEYFRCVEESDTRVVYETKRKGAPKPQTCTWTIEDAKRADLLQTSRNGEPNNWLKYPRAMLKARSKAWLARDVYPDILAGVYLPDELEDEYGRDEQVIDAEFVESPRDEAPVRTLVEQINEATTYDGIMSFAPAINKLQKGSQERLAAWQAHKDRLKWLESQPRDAQPNGTAA